MILFPPKALLSVHFPKNRTKSYIDAVSIRIPGQNSSECEEQDDREAVSLENGEEMLFNKVYSLAMPIRLYSY